MSIDTSTEAVDALCTGPLSEIAMSQGLPVTQQDVETVCIAAATIRALAAERDRANKEVYGLADEREKWKARAEAAKAELTQLRTACDEWAETSQRNYQRAKAAEAKLKRARGALEFYADPSGDVPDFYSELDFGDRARTALDEIKGDG